MKTLPLQYEISNWTQLSQCLSNNSDKLHIRVSQLLDADVLSGVRISVEHESYGVLFATVLADNGDLISTDVPNLQTESILEQLRKFGFIIKYSSRQHLSGTQIAYLITLSALGFDKLRVVCVENRTYVVGFSIADHPNWLSNAYQPDYEEFCSGVVDGSVINVGRNSAAQSFDWSWLNYVADISDILRDNQEG